MPNLGQKSPLCVMPELNEGSPARVNFGKSRIDMGMEQEVSSPPRFAVGSETIVLRVPLQGGVSIRK